MSQNQLLTLTALRAKAHSAEDLSRGIAHALEAGLLEFPEMAVEPSPSNSNTPNDGSGDPTSTEATGGIGSLGGHDPRADRKPTRNLVRSFGKWAKGRQSTCVKVLMRNHPELCAGRPGGCNPLCAYLKDQFLGSTKWREGRRRGRRVLEAYIPAEMAEDGTVLESEIVFDPFSSLDIIAESEFRESDAYEAVERPEWLDDDLEQKIMELMDAETDDDDDISHEELSQLIRTSISNMLRSMNEESNRTGWTYSTYPSVQATYDDYVIVRVTAWEGDGRDRGTSTEVLWRIKYAMENDELSLGEPVQVRMAYVTAEGAVDDSEEALEASNYNLVREVDAADRIQSRDSYEEMQSRVRTTLQKKYETRDKDGHTRNWVSVRATYKDYVVFSMYGEVESDLGSDTLYMQSYKIVDGEIELEGEKTRVVVKYVKPAGVSSESSYQVVESDGKSYAVKLDESGEIVEGPDHLIGRLGVPRLTLDAAESIEGVAFESATLELAMDCPVLAAEASPWGMAESGKYLTPSGREVDAVIRVISVGPGNSGTRFYYTQEAINNTLSVFEGRKMYKDHLKPEEIKHFTGVRNVDDWVSTIKEVWTGEDAIGLTTGYAGVDFVDDAFRRKVQLGREDIGTSIMGKVRAKPGKIDGAQYNVVEAFTYGFSVDWVTEAGARGGVEAVAESYVQEGAMPEITESMTLDEALKARPELFVDYAARLGKPATESTDNKTETEDQVGLTTEQAEEIARKAAEAAVEVVTKKHEEEIDTRVAEGLANGFEQRDRQLNARSLRDKLAASRLPEATRKRLAVECKDLFFHDTTVAVEADAEKGIEASESLVLGTTLFDQEVDRRIAEARQELAEVAGAPVIDLGPTGLSTAEGRQGMPAPAGGLDAHESFTTRLQQSRTTRTAEKSQEEK